jgi:hypothetical protein
MGAISAFLGMILWRRAGKTYTFVMSYSHGQFAPENTTETGVKYAAWRFILYDSVTELILVNSMLPGSVANNFFFF